MEEITVNYSDVLEGQWCVRGGLQPEVDQKIAPEIMPPRYLRVPLTLNKGVKE